MELALGGRIRPVGAAGEGTAAILFLDLDLVIVASIDCLFAHPGAFCIIENWTQRGRGIGNSSVFRFEAGAHRAGGGSASLAVSRPAPRPRTVRASA